MALRDRQPGVSLARIVFYMFARGVAVLALKIVFKATAEGTENIPQTGAILMVANHQSYLDPPAVGGFVGKRHFEFLARASLFRFKPFAWLISLLNSVPIQDDQGDSGAIREILRRLEGGRAVLIFPEGSRSEDGQMHDFKRGAALVMRKAKCPVIPAAITGAYQRWPASEKWPRLSGPPVRVKYGTVIPYDELMKGGADAAMARLRDEVARLKAQLDAKAAAPGQTAARPS
ncbi:MAG TPA: lysophospholipid acyltransferase family protein [Candidatus Dormibacteraeota bacterium]